jgi:hypothetical protein
MTLLRFCRSLSSRSALAATRASLPSGKGTSRNYPGKNFPVGTLSSVVIRPSQGAPSLLPRKPIVICGFFAAVGRRRERTARCMAVRLLFEWQTTGGTVLRRPRIVLWPKFVDTVREDSGAIGPEKTGLASAAIRSTNGPKNYQVRTEHVGGIPS